MKIILTIISFLTISAFYSCNQCNKVDCQNGGLCSNGACLCEKWYSGENCGLLFNRNYDGNYYGKINSTDRNEHGVLKVFSDTIVPNRIVLDNGVYLEFQNDSQLVIPTQILALYNDTLPIVGSGEFKNDSLIFSYENQYLTRSVIYSFCGTRVD